MSMAYDQPAMTAPKTVPASLRAPQRDRSQATLSLIIPMHNETAVMDLLFERIEATIGTLGVALEIVCIDDGSTDETYARLEARCAADTRIRALQLSRNFGKEAALTAGLEACTGDIVVCLDADLQDPPELVAEFVALWEQGYDVVYGVRTDRSSDTRAKRLTAGWFYKVFNALSDVPIPASTGDFRLMDRQVVEALKQFPERNRFMKGIFTWVGYRQVGVPYARPVRAAGHTSWSYLRLWRFALDGVTAFTTLPLRVWTMVGVGSAVIAVLYALALVIRVLVVGREAPGYASMMVVMLFGIAFQLIALGVLGEYIGRMYEEVKRRPIYMVRDRSGFEG